MRRFMRKLLDRSVPRPHEKFYNCGFAQEGEDIILERLLPNPIGNTGFYVDIGAHHPFRFSNTYYYYRKGWRGINVDAMPGSMDPFRVYRPRDINVEAAISEQPSELTYYIFNEPALNGFSADLARSRDGVGPYRIVKQVSIQTQRLDALLHQHLPNGQFIDFLSVDVEGLDLEVLRSNDWSLYRPRFVLAEDASITQIVNALNCPVAAFLGEKGYVLRSKLVHTMIFEDLRATAP